MCIVAIKYWNHGQYILQCWKSRVRDSEGLERVSRGCTTRLEQVPLYCATHHHGHTKRQAGGQYAIDCCTGDFCNNGSFPQLPPIIYIPGMMISRLSEGNGVDLILSLNWSSALLYVWGILDKGFCQEKNSWTYHLTDPESAYPDHSAYIWKLTIAILGPIVVLGALGSFVILLMRRRHRKRLIVARSLHSDPESFCASDDMLRATAAGDTTLRVSNLCNVMTILN